MGAKRGGGGVAENYKNLNFFMASLNNSILVLRMEMNKNPENLEEESLQRIVVEPWIVKYRLYRKQLVSFLEIFAALVTLSHSKLYAV